MPASDEEAAPAQARSGAEETGIGAAELAAVPAGTRAVLETVLDRMETMRAKLGELKADKAGMAARLRAVKAKQENEAEMMYALAEQAERRRMQGAEPEPEPEEYVHLIKRTATTGSACEEAACTPGGTTNDGSFDYGICDDLARACCYRAACAGHGDGGRRLQAGGGTGGKCSAADLYHLSAAINLECCDEPGEDCGGGYPHTCNAGCAALLLPFWRDCRAALGKESEQFEPAVQLCAGAGTGAGTGAVAAGGSSLSEHLSVQCTDGTAVEDCIPECNAERHGFILLLNLNGDDTNLVCNLAHGLYSWMGAASEGGYIGSDFESFFASVISGAAGTYMATLTEDRDVRMDLTIEPGQVVLLSGDRALATPPTWGSGGFTFSDGSSLSLTYVTLSPGDPNCDPGDPGCAVYGTWAGTSGVGHLQVNHCVFTPDVVSCHGISCSWRRRRIDLDAVTAVFTNSDLGDRQITGNGRVTISDCTFSDGRGDGAPGTYTPADGGTLGGGVPQCCFGHPGASIP